MKQLILILSFTLCLATTAQAGYIENKIQWAELSDINKQAYVMGLVDQYMNIFRISDTWLDQTLHHENCVADLDMKPANLVELIDTQYNKDVSSWQSKPAIILQEGLVALCGSH